MTRIPFPLASDLQDEAFTVSAGIQQGLTRQAVRHQRFARPHHGVRKLHVAVPQNEFVRDGAKRLAGEYAPLLRPDEAFSHTTALLLLKVPVHTPPEVHVTVPHHVPHARGKNVNGHRTRLAFRPIKGFSGLPCVPHAKALMQSARMLSFRELVVGIDHLLRIRGKRGSRWSLSTPDALHRLFHDRAVPGVDRLRAALEVARIGADSRMETLLHFELARMGADTLEMQGEIFSDSGEWIGRFDQVDRVAKRICEYDGEQHRTDRKQYLHDDKRLDFVRREHWTVRRFHKEDFQDHKLEATRGELCDFLELTPQPPPRHLVPYFAEPLHLP